MDARGKKMDNTCAWAERVVRFAERQKQLPIRYVGTGSSWATAPRPCVELVYMFEGQCTALQMGPRRFAFPHGHLGLVSVHHGNYAVGPQKFRGWCVFLDVAGEPDFDRLYHEPLFCLTPATHPQTVLDAFRRLVLQCKRVGFPQDTTIRRDARRIDLPSEIFMKTAFLDLMAVFLQEVLDPGGPPAQAVNSAMEYIRLNYTKPGSALDDVADAVYLSPDHFGRQFKAATGQSPMQYLRQVRIEQSCFLLRNTSLTVDRIAREVGFQDPYYFSRTFRQLKGGCPREFRR